MTFTRGEAECLPVAAASVQLVVVGRAIHYFDTRAFFREVDRVLVGDHTLLSYVYVACGTAGGHRSGGLLLHALPHRDQGWRRRW